MSDYKFRRELRDPDYPDWSPTLQECQGCRAVAPLKDFEAGPPIQKTRTVYLCNLCAGTTCGTNATAPYSRPEDPNRHILETICHVGNALLDWGGKFEGVETVDLPPEWLEDEGA